MNNSVLVSLLDQLVATNRFSQARKACLAEFIGKEFAVSGIVTRVRITTGYLRRKGLRKGKTITLQMAGCDTVLTIRCNRERSVDIGHDNETDQFVICFTVTGYNDVRQQLEGDEIEDSKPVTLTDALAANGVVEVSNEERPAIGSDYSDPLDSTPTDGYAAQLLAELEEMQKASLKLLSDVAEDIDKAQSSNVPLVVAPTDAQNDANSVEIFPIDRNDSLPQPIAKPLPPQSKQQKLDDTEAFQPTVNSDDIPQAIVVPESRHKSIDIVDEVEVKQPSPPGEVEQSSDVQRDGGESNDTITVKETDRETQRKRLHRLRRDILSDQQKPVGLKDFGQIIALETGVSVDKVKEIQKELWRAIMSPSFFGKKRGVFNFFPFGKFRLLRNRGVVNMDFKSAPVRQIAEHKGVEDYPHSNFDASPDDPIHPPIATHAIRIAAVVAPLVGLSPPVTYDVIFETLQLLLKVFGVGKRRVRFADIGEFFPVVLRGILQYHFRPYRPLIQFATESFREILLLAESEGEGQLAFEADQGVPDRTRRSRTVLNRDRKKKTPNGWVLLIVVIIVYQAAKLLFD